MSPEIEQRIADFSCDVGLGADDAVCLRNMVAEIVTPYRQLLLELAREHLDWMPHLGHVAGRDGSECGCEACVEWRLRRDRFKALGCWEDER